LIQGVRVYAITGGGMVLDPCNPFCFFCPPGLFLSSLPAKKCDSSIKYRKINLFNPEIRNF